MTPEQFESLRIGDIVRHIHEGRETIIVGERGDNHPAVGVNIREIVFPADWELVKGDHGQALAEAFASLGEEIAGHVVDGMPFDEWGYDEMKRKEPTP